MSEIEIQEWKPAGGADEVRDALATVLHAAVINGASVSFILPFSMDDARAFWREKVLPGVRNRTRRVLFARWNGEIAGTVQLDLAMPPNQRHRADVAKLLVHPEARRRGIARALMVALEEVAREENRTLLTLDTVTGGSAEHLYLSLGYHMTGTIPRYALNSDSTKLEGTSILYKEMGTPAGDASTL